MLPYNTVLEILNETDYFRVIIEDIAKDIGMMLNDVSWPCKVRNYNDYGCTYCIYLICVAPLNCASLGTIWSILSLFLEITLILLHLK